MYEPPADLRDDGLRAALRVQYGLEVAELNFLALGYDSWAWVYRVRTAEGATYFLKVRLGAVDRTSLLVPRYLHDRGVRQVIAPLPTSAGGLCAEMAGFSLILYPFVAGVSGMEQGMTPQQWIDYGAILRQVHGTALPPYLEQIMRRETFVPSGATTLRHLDAHLNERDFDDDPTGRALAGFWRERREEIAKLVARAEELGRRLAGQGLPFVLCHADIHTANVLLDSRGNVWIVDWDETVLAPRERDLMFAVGGIIGGVVGPREEELFFQGYGPTTVDPLGLAYYRYAWAVSDIAAWGSEVVFRPDLGPASRKASADSFMRLFLPGNIASLAFASGV